MLGRSGTAGEWSSSADSGGCGRCEISRDHADVDGWSAVRTGMGNEAFSEDAAPRNVEFTEATKAEAGTRRA